MTVETSDRKQTFSGGQANLTFSFRTLVSDPSYIKLLIKNVSTGVETELTYTTDYSVAVNADGIGGTVTVSPTYSTAYNYVVYRETAAVQTDDYDDFNQFPADTIENSLDRAVLIAQEQAEETTRTLRYPISASGTSTELPTPEALSYLRWNSTANAIENAALPDPSTLSKASTLEAQAGVEDSHYMTAAKTAAAITALATGLTKASQAVAEAASNDTTYMTPLQVKNEVQKSGAVLIPSANVNLAVAVPIGSTTASTGAFTTLKVGTTRQGDILYDNGTSLVRLPPGTSGQYLKTLGASANPTWSTITVGSSYTAGTYKIYGPSAFKSTTSITYVKLIEVIVPRAGTLTTVFTGLAVGGAADVSGRIYRNGVAVGTDHTVNGGATWTEDISGWSAGDLLQVYGNNNSSGSTAYVGGLYLSENIPAKEVSGTGGGVTQSGGPQIYTGPDEPATVVGNSYGSIGDIYINTAGGAATTFYVKTGASTWTAK